MCHRRCHHRDADAGPLPEVLVADLGGVCAEPPPAALEQRPEHGSLGLQRAGAGEMELDVESEDVHRTAS
jgi:hypothetical protein